MSAAETPGVLDVLVHGAGPAGAATALALARGGFSDGLAERPETDRGRPPFGETVPPEVVRPLARLGVWDAFRAGGHLPAPGTVVCWGDDRPFENESMFNPYGHGWHLDRRRFDRMLRDAAVAAGARPVDASGPAPRAGLVVDATGRTARIARARGATRHRTDRQVGLVRFGPARSADSRTVVESCPEGWWYAAVLPGRGAVTALFTDADLLPSGPVARNDLWAAALARTRLVRDVAAPGIGRPGADSPGAGRIWVAPAQVGALDTVTGPGWTAVGDAARTLDPLSGQGVLAALESAVETADALLGPDPAAGLDALSRRTAERHREQRRQRAAHYRHETRWPHRPFWRRRHGTNRDEGSG